MRLSKEDYLKNEDVAKFFARAHTLKPRVPYKPDGYLTEEEWANARSVDESLKESYERSKARSGLQNFRRQVFGFWKKDTIKTLEELTSVVQSIRIAETVDEAKKFISLISNHELRTETHKYLMITPVINSKGNSGFRITYSSDENYVPAEFPL